MSNFLMTAGQRRLALTQGIFFLMLGVWPVLHIDSFLVVTGPKTDVWLVKTVGLLITAIGVALLAATWDVQLSRPLALVAMLSALFLAGVDVYYVATETIWPVYLLDAVVEIAFVVLWVRLMPRPNTSAQSQ